MPTVLCVANAVTDPAASFLRTASIKRDTELAAYNCAAKFSNVNDKAVILVTKYFVTLTGHPVFRLLIYRICIR